LVEPATRSNFIFGDYSEFGERLCRPTVCVTGAGAGVDNVREQKKTEARKMFENAAESPASSARCVGRFNFLLRLL
jgi:hypothetical protein